MIGRRVPYNEAYEKTQGNKARIFAVTGKGGRSGYERIHKEAFPDIIHKPKFKLESSMPVFTLGSCFARNIEGELSKHGVKCLTTALQLPAELYEAKGVGSRNGALNAYTPASMLNLLRLSAGGFDATFAALKTGDDEWLDMLMSGLRPLSLEELGTVRKGLYDVYESAKKADVFIITLGYTESWFDKENGVYVNRSPGASIKSHKLGDRYEFHNLDASQVIESLEACVELIRHITNGKARVLFTVSPVPLHATFTNQDVILANAYSKSTLLSAAQTVSQRNDSVDYFPSYEMVSFTDAGQAWLEDGVHVNPAVVSQVVSKFHSLYYTDA